MKPSYGLTMVSVDQMSGDVDRLAGISAITDISVAFHSIFTPAYDHDALANNNVSKRTNRPAHGMCSTFPAGAFFRA